MAVINHIEISTDALNGDIREFQTQIGGIESETKGLFEAVQTLNSMWTGPANAAFNKQFLQDYDIMMDVVKCLNQYADSLAYASREYQNCEEKVRQTVLTMR